MRVDDYKNAFKLAFQELASKDPIEVSKNSASIYNSESQSYIIDFFNQQAVVDVKNNTVTWQDTLQKELSIIEGVLILHYLNGAQNIQPGDEFIAYRQIIGGEFYHSAFTKRAEEPLAKTFGQEIDLFEKCTKTAHGQIVEQYGDIAATFKVLPKINIMLIIYLADEEFEAQANVLFDKTIGSFLPVEDISWLGAALVYRLMALSKNIH